MPKPQHAKDAAQSHDVFEDATREQTREQLKRERGPAQELGKVEDKRAQLTKVVSETRKNTEALGEEVQATTGKLAEALKQRSSREDAFIASAVPDRQDLQVRETLGRTQDELLKQAQDRERGKELANINAVIKEASESVLYAIQSMTTRHEATASTLTKEHSEQLEAARKQNAGATNQREHEQAAAEKVSVLLTRQNDDAVRVAKFQSEMGAAVRAFMKDVEQKLVQGANQSQEQWMAQAKDLLEQFQERRDQIVAYRLLWHGCFADIDEVKKTWERAAKDQKETPEGFAKAREKFWERVNSQVDDDAKRVHRLLDILGVEWQGDTRAPLLRMESRRLDEMRQAAEAGQDWAITAVRREQDARRLTIDHLADKSSHSHLTLDPLNLRLLANSDNSARGNKRDVADSTKLDLEHSEEWKALNKERSDQRAANRLEKAEGRIQTQSNKLEEFRSGERERMVAARQAADLEAARKRGVEDEHKVRNASPRLAEGATEEVRRHCTEENLEMLRRFQEVARSQAEVLHAFERKLCERQSTDLAQAQQGAPRDLDVRELVERERSFERRVEKDRRSVEAIDKSMNVRRNDAEGELFKAILSAATLQEREEHFKLAFEKLHAAAELQRQLMGDFERRRNAQG